MRASLRSAALASVLGAAACTAQPNPITLDAPSEPLFVAALAVEDGAVVGASGLVRWVPGQGLPLFVDRSKEHWLLGFTDADLASLTLPEADRLAALPLATAEGCAPRLPAASWRARWPDGAPGPEAWPAELSLPALTASWLDGQCEAVVDDRWMVETSCNDFGVFPTVNATNDRCVRELGLANYVLPTLRAHLSHDGTVCAETAAPNPACHREVGDSSAVSCMGTEPCRLSVRLTELREAPFTTQVVRLYPEVEDGPLGRFDANREYRALRTKVGYVRSMAVLPDSIWIAARRRPLGPCPSPTEDGADMELVRISRATLSIVQTSTAPSCLNNLRPSSGGGFHGTFSRDGGSWMGLFDAEGRLLRGRRLGRGPGDPAWTNDALVPEFVTTAGSDRLMVALADDRNVAETLVDSQLLFVDPSSLEEVGRIPSPPAGQITWVEALEPGRAALSFHSSNLIQFVDVEAQGLEGSLPFDHDPGQGTFGLAYRPPLLALAAQNMIFLFDLDRRAEVYRGALSARPMTHVRVVPWPADPNLLLVLGMPPRSRAPLVTLATFFDLRERRFQPVAFELGSYGVPHQVTPDGAGGFYILHPWSSELTHLIPRNP